MCAWQRRATGLRERKNERTRAAITRATLELTLERGFEGATIAQIAERADVSPRTIHTWFSSKEEIVLGRSSENVDRLAHALEQGDGGHHRPDRALDRARGAAVRRRRRPWAPAHAGTGRRPAPARSRATTPRRGRAMRSRRRSPRMSDCRRITSPSARLPAPRSRCSLDCAPALWIRQPRSQAPCRTDSRCSAALSRRSPLAPEVADEHPPPHNDNRRGVE